MSETMSDARKGAVLTQLLDLAIALALGFHLAGWFGAVVAFAIFELGDYSGREYLRITYEETEAGKDRTP